MSNSIVQINNQTLEIDGTVAVNVSTIVDDGSGTGTWVRTINIYGSPGGTNANPILSVQIKSTVQANLEVTTPNLQF